MLTRQTRTDLTAAVAAILVGAGFLMLARQIHTPKSQTAAEAMVGPAMVPTIVAVLIIVLGALEAFIIVLHYRRVQLTGPERDTPKSEFAELSFKTLIRLAAVVAIGFSYVWLLSATGYIISTAITLTLLLLLFGSRPSPGLAVIVIAGTSVYFYLFIKLMGIYDPSGWLINLG